MTSQTSDLVRQGRYAEIGAAAPRRPATRPAEKAVLFDPQRRAGSEGLKAAVRALWSLLEQQETALGLRQHRRSAGAQRGFRLAVEALACNLAVITMLHLDRPLAVTRNHGAIWGAERYRSPVYGQHFLDALDLMAHPEIGLIEDMARGFKFPGSKAQRSTVRPTPNFSQHVPPSLLTWPALARDEDPEVLVLRKRKDSDTGKAAEIDYPDTAVTRRRRNQVRRINSYLRAAPLFVLPDASAEDDAGQPIDPTRRTVRRIFHNGCWKQGGRLYGAFWETMRRADRFRLMRIGTETHPRGETIANVDYGQLFARLAYHVLAYRPPPEGDLYDIAGDGSNREGWKRLVNALLLTTKPLRNWPEGLSKEFPPRTKLRGAIEAVRERHAPIAHLFGTGAGFKLMLVESELLIGTVLRLFHQGITALPLHDSVIVAGSAVAIAEATMQDVFGGFTERARAAIKVDLGE